MSARMELEKQKLIQDKCHTILSNMLREEDNKYCVDCDAKGPRWASWNLGIFLCIRCAGIHRNLGVHISKVKSVNLDSWTPEQVAYLQQMGNSQARAVYEANLPENFRRPQYDSALEAFIRAKYEQKKYIAKEWVPPPPPKPAFDIEEEKKKEKEKKKKDKNVASIQIPPPLQLKSMVPRPHSTTPVSPSPKVGENDVSKTTVPQVPVSADLLNLDSGIGGENDFDQFLSAPLGFNTTANSTAIPSSDESSNTKTTIADEEIDFFNQKYDETAVQASKMSKESILSLYGANSNQVQPSQPVAPMYGIPGGMFVPQQAFTQVPSYTVLPNSTVGLPAANLPMYSPYTSLGSTAMKPNANTISFGGTNDSVLLTPGIGQLSQQVQNLHIGGQMWSVPQAPSQINPASVIMGPNPQNVPSGWPPVASQNQGIQKWQ